MTDYHATSTIELASLQSLAGLESFLAGKRPALATFEDFERELGVHMRRVECEAKELELARYDVEADVIVVGGVELRRCLGKEPKTYNSASGPVTVARNLFRPATGGKSVCPLDALAGMMGSCTPLLARQVCFLMGHMTSTETASVFKEMGIDGPSSSTCDRVPKLVSPVWETNRDAWEAALRASEEVPGEATVLACSSTR